MRRSARGLSATAELLINVTVCTRHRYLLSYRWFINRIKTEYIYEAELAAYTIKTAAREHNCTLLGFCCRPARRQQLIDELYTAVAERSRCDCYKPSSYLVLSAHSTVLIL